MLGEHFPSVSLLCQGQLLMRAGPCHSHLRLPGATPVWSGQLGSGRAPIQQGWEHSGPWRREVLALPTREGTHAPCRGGTEAQSQDHQGIPRAMSILNIPFMPSISSHIKDTADNRKPFVEGQEE